MDPLCFRNGNPMCWGLANTLVFKKVRTALGFDRCKYFFSGAAPITKDTIDFFLSLNITIQDIYGMSESTGKLSTFYMSVNQQVGIDFFLSLKITIQDIYGMSESTGKLSTFYMSVNQQVGIDFSQFEHNHSGHIRHERINR